MKEKTIADKLASLLPNRSVAHATCPEVVRPDANKNDLAIEEATRIVAKREAKELARIKQAEMARKKQLEAELQEQQKAADELNIDISEVPDVKTASEVHEIIERQKRVEAIEAIEAEAVEPLSVTRVAKNSNASPELIQRALQLQGTSRPEIAKLLTSLNINLSVQLSKQDTANLLACLLTCNESQLTALYNNKKIPMAIKIIIKRLMEDSKVGVMDTVEKLWDRVFGKVGMQQDQQGTQDALSQFGGLPNTPLSREAYIVIRDTLIQ